MAAEALIIVHNWSCNGNPSPRGVVGRGRAGKAPVAKRLTTEKSVLPGPCRVGKRHGAAGVTKSVDA